MEEGNKIICSAMIQILKNQELLLSLAVMGSTCEEARINIMNSVAIRNKLFEKSKEQ